MIRCPLITDNLIQSVHASGGPPASGLVRAAISLFAESGGSTAIHMPLRVVASVDRCLRRPGGSFPAGYGPCQIPGLRADVWRWVLATGDIANLDGRHIPMAVRGLATMMRG
ncbi:MAG: hypothetical protein ACLP9L_37940 [Thermoguttaceae bacterium]